MANFIQKLLGTTAYVSELDQFLAHLRREYPALSASQTKEVAKYSRLNALRDHPTQSETLDKTISWDKF